MGSSRLAETDSRRRPGHRRRADAARPGPLPQGGAAVEDPDAGSRLPQLDAPPGRQRHLPDGPGPGRAGGVCRSARRRRPPDPILGPPSLSVGRIEGGQSVNIVPDWCEIEIDRRLIPGEEPGQALEQARAFLGERLGSLDGIEFGRPGSTCPPWCPGSSRLGRPAQGGGREGDGTRARGGGSPLRHRRRPARCERGFPAWSSGRETSPRPIRKDEWVDLDQVRQAAEAYYQIACALG